MGNLPSKKGETRNESVNHSRSLGPDLDESIQKKVDPLAIFGIKELTKQEIVEFLESPAFKKKYQSLMIQHHPDRGGSVLKSSIINFAYEKLCHAKDTILLFSSQREKTGNEIREESRSSKQEHSVHSKEIQEKMKALMKGDKGEFQKKFNEAFERTKMSDYMDDGVEVEERTKSTKRGTISISRDPQLNESNMNDVFEKKATVNQALVVRSQRQPEGVSSLRQSVYEYGKKEENDFSRFTKGAADYRIAYAGERLVDLSNSVPEGKNLTGKVSLTEAKRIRSLQNTKPEMSESEMEEWAKEKEEEELYEEERKANLVERDYEAKQRQNIFIERMLTLNPNLN